MMQTERNLTKVVSTSLVLGTVVLLALAGLIGSWFVIDQGERGILLRNGGFVRVAEPGLGFKVPFIDSVTELSVRTEKRIYKGLGAYSKDIQLAQLDVSVNYRLDVSDVRSIYEKFGSREAAIDRIITPRVADEVKVVFGQFNAKTSIEERGRLGIEMLSALKKSVEGSGVIVEALQIEGIDFSKAFEQSIEARMQAEVEVAKLKQNLERERVQADIVRTQAQGQADATLAKAKAEALSIKLRGDAEAEAIKARSTALRENAALIELTKAEKWDGKLPTTMLPSGLV